jgi:hypothetical protein
LGIALTTPSDNSSDLKKRKEKKRKKKKKNQSWAPDPSIVMNPHHSSLTLAGQKETFYAYWLACFIRVVHGWHGELARTWLECVGLGIAVMRIVALKMAHVEMCVGKTRESLK